MYLHTKLFANQESFNTPHLPLCMLCMFQYSTFSGRDELHICIYEYIYIYIYIYHYALNMQKPNKTLYIALM